MDTLHQKRRQVYPRWLKIIIVTVLLLGIYFRFTNLNGKVYWSDEVYTSLWLSGHSSSEVVNQVYNGQVISINQLKKYQQPNLEKGVSSTIERLALEDPQHPPLYYVIAWFWSQLFGNSVAAIRSLSAAISLLSLISIYYLCQELFALPLTSLIAVSLMAISPFHILYAQEARQYSLWILTILISSYALLRALRKKSFSSWVIYTITITLSFYTFLLSIFIAIGHGIYVWLMQRLRLTPVLLSYFTSLIAAIIIFIPWLIIVSTGKAEGRIQRLDWIEKSTSLSSLVGKWILNITRIFIDWININEQAQLKAFFLIFPLALALLILIAYSIYYLCRSTPKSSWLFILTLTLTTAIFLIVPDVISGGRRSGVPRYMIPTFLGIQLMIACLLSSKIIESRVKISRQIWTGVTILLLANGVISNVIISSSETWWNKGDANNGNLHQIASIINKTAAPLIVSDAEFTTILGFMHLLKSDTDFQLTQQPSKLVITEQRENIFLFKPSADLEKNMQKDYDFNPLYKSQGYSLELVKLRK
ncbi:hypothetical protein NIES22_31750 [Calothrix brevissima NIES-22]|nr:hypothetical protein NIES22_31750 [Calothrix brevissima NIES-22]